MMSGSVGHLHLGRALLCLLLIALASSLEAAAQRPLALVNDPDFSKQWNLHDPTVLDASVTPDIQALAAWDVTTGTSDTIVAVLDTGVDLDHPDLTSKIWTNPGEIPSNGRDDDGNGKVDDVNGWDFVDADNRPDDPTGWGTFMAGIAGAASNNEIGVASVAWNAPILPVRILTRDELGIATASVENIVNGISYAVNNGARIIHLGFYIEADRLGPGPRALLEEAINAAAGQGAVLIAPVGDLGLSNNPMVYPATFDAVLGVTATDRSMERLSTTGHGLYVDIAAPGVQLYGPVVDGQYDFAGGTEFAAAHVAGTAALIWAVNPSLSPRQVRDFIRQSADDLGPVGLDEFYGFGLLNTALALQLTPHLLQISPHDLHFHVDEFGSAQPRAQDITNFYTGGLTWRASTQARWLEIEGLTETTPSTVTVSLNLSTIPHCGQYTGQIIAESNQTNRVDGQQVVDVTLEFAKTRCDRVYLSLVTR